MHPFKYFKTLYKTYFLHLRRKLITIWRKSVDKLKRFLVMQCLLVQFMKRCP